ncbi:MAG: hypothetical protein WKG07_09035 [Hymenobacter sp.]
MRLTAEGGYQAERSYSVASPPEQTGEIELTVEADRRRRSLRLPATRAWP